MNAKLLISAIIVMGFFTGGYLYSTNGDFRGHLNSLILPTREPEVTEDPTHRAIYVIFDPSGSGRFTYNVPRLAVEDLTKMAKKILHDGPGDIWLTYICRDAYRADVVHLAIPSVTRIPAAPVRQGGEPLYKFNTRLAEYKESAERLTAKVQKKREVIDLSIKEVQVRWKTMIDRAYAAKGPGEDWSDVNGALNSATRTLGTVGGERTSKSILLISDGVHDLPRGVQGQEFRGIPAGINVITVNAGGSRNHVLAGKTIEVEDLERGIEMTLK